MPSTFQNPAEGGYSSTLPRGLPWGGFHLAALLSAYHQTMPLGLHAVRPLSPDRIATSSSWSPASSVTVAISAQSPGSLALRGLPPCPRAARGAPRESGLPCRSNRNCRRDGTAVESQWGRWTVSRPQSPPWLRWQSRSNVLPSSSSVTAMSIAGSVGSGLPKNTASRKSIRGRCGGFNGVLRQPPGAGVGVTAGCCGPR